jgi:hypothetical protein
VRAAVRWPSLKSSVKPGSPGDPRADRAWLTEAASGIAPSLLALLLDQMVADYVRKILQPAMSATGKAVCP